jgi:hypothetical protein
MDRKNDASVGSFCMFGLDDSRGGDLPSAGWVVLVIVLLRGVRDKMNRANPLSSCLISGCSAS